MFSFYTGTPVLLYKGLTPLLPERPADLVQSPARTLGNLTLRLSVRVLLLCRCFAALRACGQARPFEPVAGSTLRLVHGYLFSSRQINLSR